ncbi:hypothetical protein GCM10017083_19830 [Thalassobaculum fulvum]|uniref:Outer membrane protein beta-barrel domain-containing protein n=1 Tax=Thalassobaculum fulvum TaxID=1633335 RepID=A0A919CQH4_9PROT|nr:hypothetical protein GCM10017083_19830 [Thalassobaculum fulvum]
MFGSVPGSPGRRRYAEGGALAAQPHRNVLSSALTAALVGAILIPGGAARADETAPDTASWYIVGGPEAAPAGFGGRAGDEGRPSRVDFGVTFSRISPRDIITFTAGPTKPQPERSGGYSFLVSGAYDFETGTLVTPRIVGGIGVSYLGDTPGGASSGSDPTARQDVAPTALIGFGADFDLGDTWAVSAEYRAMYLGETERDGRLGESRLDQKFTVGAKIRF